MAAAAVVVVAVAVAVTVAVAVVTVTVTVAVWIVVVPTCSLSASCSDSHCDVTYTIAEPLPTVRPLPARGRAVGRRLLRAPLAVVTHSDPLEDPLEAPVSMGSPDGLRARMRARC